MYNLKLTNAFREEGGRWMNAGPVQVAYALTLLRFHQDSEPTNGWHLETCGTLRMWHSVNPRDLDPNWKG